MTRVYVDMVADLFHWGHVEFLRQARALGDQLVVGIHSDSAVESYKRAPVLTMEERIRVVQGCRYVDEVLARAPITIEREWIERHQIDIVAHGSDFDEETMISFYKVPISMGIFRVLPYTPNISTSSILSRIEKRLSATRDAN